MSPETARAPRAIDALKAGGRILVTRLQYLGDVILSLPLVDAIRERYPRAELDYLCRPPASELLGGDPRFGRVFALSPGAGAAQSLSLIRALRSRRYDVVIDLYSNPRSAWLSFFTGAKTRIGGDRRGRRFLYTTPVTVSPRVRSALAHHLAYGAPLDISLTPRRPAISVAPAEVEAARERLEACGVETRRPDRARIAIHPGGKWKVKRWPAHCFAGLAERLQSAWDADVVVLTGPGERHHTERVVERTGGGVTVLPEMDVRSVAAVLSLLDATVVSDGGIMHLSAAVGTPTVGIFGSAEPEIWFPYEAFGPFRQVSIPLDCRPCHRHVCPLGHTACLNDLSVGTVLETLRRALDGRRAAGETGGSDG